MADGGVSDGLVGRRAVVVGAGGALADAAVAMLRTAGAEAVRATDGPAAEAVLRFRASDRVDVVVHVSAPSRPRAFLEREATDWAADVDARVGEPVRVARAAAERMKNHGGCIVFVGTLDAVHAYHGHADASVGMGALLGLVRSLAVELAPLGVRANAVLVGPLAEGQEGAAEARAARTRLRSPSGRPVTAQEAAAAIAFVAGPGAAFMTGAALRVDAGWASLNQAPDGMRFP